MRCVLVLAVAVAACSSARTPGPGIDVGVWPEGRDPASPDQRRDYAASISEEARRRGQEGGAKTAGDRDEVLVLVLSGCTVEILEVFARNREEGAPAVSPRRLGFRRLECGR